MGSVFTLPVDWLERVNALDFDGIRLNEFEFEMANIIKAYIERDEENSVANRVVQVFLQYAFNGRKSFLSGYENIPIGLARNVLSEIGGERGQAFNNKLHACAIELLAYRKLNDVYDYRIVDHTRRDGDCDLIVENRNKDRLEIEVKYKQGPEAPSETLRHFMFGMSFLPENVWMHGKKYSMTLKAEGINDKVMQKVLEDAKSFFDDPDRSEYETDLIRVNREKDMPAGTLYISTSDGASLIYCPSEEDVFTRIDGVLIDGEGGSKQIDKLFFKYNRDPSDRYNGFLAWTMPWFWEDEEPYEMEANIKAAFKRVIAEKYCELPFDLYVWANGFGTDKMLLLKRDI